MTSLAQSILKTLAYSDIFNFPLKLEEINQGLISPMKYSSPEIKKTLDLLKKRGMVDEKGTFFFLKGRQGIVSQRQRRQKSSQFKLQKATQRVWWLRFIPWVKAVLLTGALARANADQDDDIDWLIITAPQRLWLTRLVAILILQTLGQRRQPNEKQIKDKICLNMFLDEKHLAFSPGKRDLFTAHEIHQSRLLYQRGGVYHDFLAANRWTRQFLGNYFTSLNRKKRPPRKTRGFLSGFFDVLEKAAFKLQFRYMKPKRTIEVVEIGRAFFHPQDARSWVMTKYQERLNRLGI